jgi:hypothetical protein
MIATWYVPSFYGDLRLQPDGDAGCILRIDRITALEEDALRKLHTLGRKKEWIDEAITADDLVKDGSFRLAAPMGKVAKELARYMKAGRRMIHVIRFANGKMYEEADAPTDDADTSARLAREEERLRAQGEGPFRTPEPAVAASVAAPTRGCPAPAFDRAEIKAREVLTAFLTPPQIEDFNAHNRFVTIGASGSRYMVTSRRAKDSLAMYSRSLFDLEASIPLCVHDWSVPAAEEMLTLHLLLQIPRWEGYLRHLEG